MVQMHEFDRDDHTSHAPLYDGSILRRSSKGRDLCVVESKVIYSTFVNTMVESCRLHHQSVLSIVIERLRFFRTPIAYGPRLALETQPILLSCLRYSSESLLGTGSSGAFRGSFCCGNKPSQHGVEREERSTETKLRFFVFVFTLCP